MAKTMQTARKSTGGRAPRMQLSSRAGRWGFNGNTPDDTGNNDTEQETLVGLYNQTQTKTIAVNGSDDIEVEPDLVRLSFKVSEQAGEYMEAIRNTLETLDRAKEKARSVGITKEMMNCDSMSVKQFTHEIKEGKKKRKVAVFEPSIILRVKLEGDKVPLFGKLMISMLQLGIENHEAPVYETTKLTDARNEARLNAIVNAKEKADIILKGLDQDLELGRPITINDIFVDIKSDSNDSFECRPWYLNIPINPKKFKENDDDDDEEGERPSEAVTIDQYMLDRESELFSVPPIRISAYIKVIFEIKHPLDEEGGGGGGGGGGEEEG